MENVQLRQFRPSDQDVVWQLHIRGLEQYGVRLNAEFIPGRDEDLARIEDEYLKGGDFLVATMSDVAIGIGAIRKIDSGTAEIKRMRVEPAYQGKGIGSLILDSLVERAKSLGYTRMILDTTERMVVAQHLYQSRGFREYRRDQLHSKKWRGD